MAILSQLGSMYSIEDELSIGPSAGEHSETEMTYPECKSIFRDFQFKLYLSKIPDPGTILRSPKNTNYKPNDEVQRKIAEYLKTIIGGNSKTIQQQLPEKMTSWAKVRIKDGDFIRCKASLAKMNRSSRDNSYVRVC